MNNLSELMEEITGTLAETANSEVVVGSPVELGPFKIVPLSKLSIGFGGGGGEGDQHCGRRETKKGKASGGKGKGAGGGGGAKVRPVGVILFSEDGVTVEKIPDRSSPLDKIFEKIPEFMDRMQKHR